MEKAKKAIVLFLIITFALSAIFYFLIIEWSEQNSGMSAIFVYMLMFCPCISAFIINRVFYHKEKILGFSKSNYKYILAGIFIPLLYWGISYGFYWLLFGNSAMTYNRFFSSPSILIVNFIVCILTAMGEEIGWRGFLNPKMNEILRFKKATFITALIWAVWHFPLIISGVYLAGTPVWYQLPVVTIMVVAIAFTMSYLRMKSNSVWPAILFHASHNFFNQLVFEPSTAGRLKPYLVGETGIISVIFSIIIVTIMIKKDKFGITDA